jgi:hypothetical protein
LDGRAFRIYNVTDGTITGNFVGVGEKNYNNKAA